MSPSKPRGLRQRIWRGWKLGFAQRDTFVIGGTLVLLVQLFAIRSLASRTRETGADDGVRERIARRMGVTTPLRRVDLKTPRGTAGWISEFSTDLTPTPAYNRRARRVPAYAPVRITGVTGDLQFVRIDVTLQGRPFTGFVQHAHVQLNDPAENMVADSGTVIVTRPGGADLRDGPSLDASVVSHVATGKTLVIAGRIRKPEFMAGVSGDYLLVRGGDRPMWVFAANATEVRD
ncbi:MAG: hypothetical protein H7099_19160 [Gemmatimonadaceae bacterium]|nr:hypothetical protein [Gemmatimonadaceae bacterium]